MFTKLKNWIVGPLWSFFQPIFVTEAGAVLTKLLPIAEGIVIQVATTGKLPNEKRDLAVSQLKQAAAAAGVDAATSLLNAAVELAYQRVQATQP